MSGVDWGAFAEKYRLAIETAIDQHFDAGTCGIEVEFNVLDERLQPVTRLGFGPESRSLADVIVDHRLPEWARSRVQREVFHWMTEFATRPYYDPRGPAWEARLLEGVLVDVLSELGLSAGHRLTATHGNIPRRIAVTADSIPDGWSLAKRRYLTRCVDLWGARLATAGIHTNHSLPEPLLAWDFIHLPRGEREGRTLEAFRSEAMIRATRVMRAYCALFIAVSASSPLTFQGGDGAEAVLLTDVDSNRLLTFPNPESLDVPGLYASHRDYLDISYDLVRSGIRFGANNWTPVRARSDVDPINRIIRTTSEQLGELYRRGIYTPEEHADMADAEQALIVENLCALVDLPMTRVEVRTDEGGDDLALSVAKAVFKQLLLLRIYADEEFGADYAYGASDLRRARDNEAEAARRGLAAVVEHPFSGARVSLREWLTAVLADLRPLAAALGWGELVEPLVAMAAGSPNPAGRARDWFAQRLRLPRRTLFGARVVPLELVREWYGEREEMLRKELGSVARSLRELGDEVGKLDELAQPFEAMGRANPGLPLRLESRSAEDEISVEEGPAAEVLRLAAALVRIPSVTNSPRERLEEVGRCARFLAATLRDRGLEVRLWDSAAYPAIVAGFPGALLAPVTLSGHFDVVEPDPNDSQFEPRIDGDYLWGRGAADMKTVVASDVVWMARRAAQGPPYPPLNLMLVGNEENGEGQPHGTPHLLRELEREHGWRPELMLVGERTGEKGDELFGQVCTANRGVVRVRFVARGERAHTGFASRPRDLLAQLVAMREAVAAAVPGLLTLEAEDGWRSTATFPFLNVGQGGVYNITADEGQLGLEIRAIPEDDVTRLLGELERLARESQVELVREVVEGGVACPLDNPHLAHLLAAVERVSGGPADLGRKLAGTSARFAPGGNAVVWGQSGIGPHSRNERHFIPSIEPYLQVLDELAAALVERYRSG